jgi:hypothetical protein
MQKDPVGPEGFGMGIRLQNPFLKTLIQHKIPELIVLIFHAGNCWL